MARKRRLHPILIWGSARAQHDFLRKRLAGMCDYYDAISTKPTTVDRFRRINKAIVSDRTKPLKMSEYVGKRVILLRDLETKGGTQFKAGDVLVVYGHWRGMLHMDDPDNPKRSIRRVNRRHVEVADG